MREGMEDVIYDVEQQEQERECEGRTGRCPQCERQGFPILPVRYAVCKNIDANRDIPELPPHRVRDFTEVTLLDALENGEKVEKKINSRVLNHVGSHPRGKVCKYILRQLRPGYFYVFDQYAYDQHMADKNNPPFFWYAYVVSKEGMFHQYPVRDTPPLPQDASFSCINAPESERRPKALSASIVTLPRVDKGNVFYYAYTEHAWSREHLAMITDDDVWRKEHMQTFTITGQPSSDDDGRVSRNTFSLNDLGLVAEYSKFSVERPDFVWPSGGERRLFSPDEMKENMQDRLTDYAGWLQGQELILAVNDEVGIIDELNTYRLEPLAELKEFIGTGDNKRMLGIMQALDAFEENFKNVQTGAIQSEHEKEDNTPYKVRRRQNLENLKRRLETTTNETARRVLQDRIENLEVQISVDNERSERSLEESLDDLEESVDKRREQVEDYYDENKEIVDRFRGEYRVKSEVAEYMTQYYDADYAFWIRDHLKKALDRYSQEDYAAGLEASGVVATQLAGGILSPASFSAWKALIKKLTSADAVLTRGLFANQRSLLEAAVQDAYLPDSDEFLPAEVLTPWVQRFEDKLDRVEASQRSELDKQWQTTIPHLIKTIGNALAAINLQATENDVIPVMTFQRLAQILYCSDPVVRRGDVPPLEMMRVEANVEAYRQWLLSIAKENDEQRQPRPRTPIADRVMYFPDEEGGNMAIDPPEDSGSYEVSFRLPLVSRQEMNIDSVDRSDIEKLEDDTTWGNIGVYKNVIGLSTMQRVSRCVVVENAGKSVVSVIAIVESIKTILEKGVFASGDKEGTDDAKLMAAIGSLVKSSVELKQSVTAVRTYLQTGEVAAAASGFWRIRAEKLTLLNVIGAGGDVLSIYDGFKKLSETSQASKSGLSGEMATVRNVQGGLSILSGGLGLTSLFIAGGPLTIAALLVSFVVVVLAYMFVELVAKAVYMWIDLSLIGNHNGQIEPFRSAQQELASLDLVFKGMTVDITWDHVCIRESTGGERIVSLSSDPRSAARMMQGANGKRFKFEIKVPSIKLLNLNLSMDTISELEHYEIPIFRRQYNNISDEDMLEGDDTYESMSSGAQVDQSKESDFFNITITMIYKNDDLLDLMRLNIIVSGSELSRTGSEFICDLRK